MEGFLNFQIEVDVWERNLPHWDGARVWTFATWRLADSLPQGLLAEWIEQRDAWLAWQSQPWSEESQREYDERFTERMDEGRHV